MACGVSRMSTIIRRSTVVLRRPLKNPETHDLLSAHALQNSVEPF